MGPCRVATLTRALDTPGGVLWSCGRVPYGDRREPCGPCGQPLDNAHALPTACPHSRASRPQPPQDQQPSRFNKTPSHLTSPTPAHHHLSLIHNAFELAPPLPDTPHRSGSSLDWKTLLQEGRGGLGAFPCTSNIVCAVCSSRSRRATFALSARSRFRTPLDDRAPRILRPRFQPRFRLNRLGLSGDSHVT